jgi:hypothetical protein
VPGYPEVAAKIDAFFARVEARHGEDMRCATGCSDCCQPGLTVTRVEAEAIRAIVPAGFVVEGDRCAALDPAGRCKIYAARPFVCRSHGAPIRVEALIRNCQHNFKTVIPDRDCVLDQTTLSALTLAVNGGDLERIDLRELLLDSAAHGHPPEPSEVQVRR